MDRRQNPRVTAHLPVRVWGVDAFDLPFIQLASVRNISSGGAVIQGIRRQILPGETLEVQLDESKAQFRVVWVGKPGTRREGEIGIANLPSEPSIWDVNLDRCSQFVGKG
jgi:PilZ domain-containing protein